MPVEMKEATRASAGDEATTLSALETASFHPTAATLQGRPPRRILWGLIAAALALHLFFLDGLGRSAQRDRVVMAPALKVRSVPAPTLVPVPLPAPEPVTAAPQQKQAVARPGAEAPRDRTQASAPVSAARAAAAAAPLAAEVTSLEPPSAAAVMVEVAASSAPSPAPAAEGDVPVYRTQLPPSMRLQYALQRGALAGSGELQWQLADGEYQLSLEGRLAGLAVLRQVSRGRIDQAGLAPQRFTDQRLRGGVQAANFQRDKGKVTFSGPTTEYPLLPGTQDRLSWMLQLAAIAAAEPARLAAGGKVILYVVGARGDADVWVFRFVDFETIETPQGPVRAAKFSRDARRLYDTNVDAWLDPTRDHLPVKARLGTSPEGEVLELQLQAVQVL